MRGRGCDVLLPLLLVAVGTPVPQADAVDWMVEAEAGGCSVSVNDKDNFPEPQPLFLLRTGSNNETEFWEPDVYNKLLTLEPGEEVILACTGSDNELTTLGVAEATAKCVSGTKFSVNGKAYRLKDLKCKLLPASSQRDSQKKCGSSAGDYPLLQIGYQLTSGFVNLIDVCFDDKQLRTVFVKATIVAGIGGYQRDFPRHDWMQGDFFERVDVNETYTLEKQRETLSDLLGSTELGEKYIKSSGNNYLDRGHLSSNGDWVFGSQQAATFWAINEAPQWHIFNEGNWKTIESNVRRYARARGTDLTVYTGTYGVATLPNAKDSETELYLEANGKKIPVPKLFWKLVHDPANDAGVVLIGINNPYVSKPGKDYYLCPNVCRKLNWITWRIDDQEKSYSYCCEVSEFQKVVSVLPDIKVSTVPYI